MSTCLFLIRDIDAVDPLRKDLVFFAKSNNFGVDFHPFDILLTHHQIPLKTLDFVFSLCDSFEHLGSCDCVLYPEGAPVNGRTHPLSFAERMMTIQQVAEIALQYSCEVELFLSDDNPYLPDFAVFDIPCQQVANTLCLQYQHCRYQAYNIPSVHMKIRNGAQIG